MTEKKVLIIGATSGIGYALAVAYARAGCIVGATGRRQEQLEELQAAAPERIFIRRHDVTAADNIAVVEELIYEMGGADIIVYNSGIGIYNKKIDWEPERDTIMRFQSFRSGFFDFPAFETCEISDHSARIQIEYQMGMRAEEAACHQSVGFFIRLLEASGAAHGRVDFASRRWAGDRSTVLALSY